MAAPGHQAALGFVAIFALSAWFFGAFPRVGHNTEFAIAVFFVALLWFGRLITGIVRSAQRIPFLFALYDSLVLPATVLAFVLAVDPFVDLSGGLPHLGVGWMAVAIWLLLVSDPTGWLGRSLARSDWAQNYISSLRAKGGLWQLTRRYPPERASDAVVPLLMYNVVLLLGLAYAGWRGLT